jgi:hypothetical protein
VSQLTRSIQDRLFIGILGLIFAPACAYLLIFWHGRPWAEETDWFIRLLVLIRIEGISAVFSVALFGVIWAIWTPDWIERRLKKAFGHFLLLVFGVSLLGTAVCFYMLFIGAV